jgi:hypothetical protein
MESSGGCCNLAGKRQCTGVGVRPPSALPPGAQPRDARPLGTQPLGELPLGALPGSTQRHGALARGARRRRPWVATQQDGQRKRKKVGSNLLDTMIDDIIHKY